MVFSPAILLTNPSPCRYSSLGGRCALALQLVILFFAPTIYAAEPGKLPKSVQLIKKVAHQPVLFTQGLELHNGQLYESSGGFGHSALMQKPMQSTGKTLSMEEKPRFIALPKNQFAEGLTVLNDKLYLLTWRAGMVYILNPADFSLISRRAYVGEGWGLCNDGSRLIMSDGSAELRFMRPDSFAEQDRLAITENGQPLKDLNELEYAKGFIFANIWHSDDIVVISPNSGEVLRRFSLAALSKGVKKPHKEAVLNGIAYDEKSDSFLITGKLWPDMFWVKLDVSGLQP